MFTKPITKKQAETLSLFLLEVLNDLKDDCQLSNEAVAGYDFWYDIAPNWSLNIWAEDLDNLEYTKMSVGLLATLYPMENNSVDYNTFYRVRD